MPGSAYKMNTYHSLRAKGSFYKIANSDGTNKGCLQHNEVVKTRVQEMHALQRTPLRQDQVRMHTRRAFSAFSSSAASL
jgi:hypothetical protein